MLDDIEQGNFIVCLKPVLEAESEEVVGAEAVVRYHHKDLGIVDPGALPDTFWRKQSFHIIWICMCLKKCVRHFADGRMKVG